MSLKIGIGLTTTPNRREYREQFIKSLTEFSPMDGSMFMVTNNDDKGEGVAVSKNRCLHQIFEAQKLDHGFLFDDDTFIKKYGWEKFFIEGNPCGYHLNYLHRGHTKELELIYSESVYESFKDCGGVFMYISRVMFEKVGYFGEYKGYGYEHAGYSQRIHLAGFNPKPFMQLKGTTDYLHSLDYDGFEKYPHLKPIKSLSESDRTKHMSENWQIYLKEKSDLKNIYKDFPHLEK